VLRKPQFAKVGEYQLRGAVHFHAIFRLDGVGPDGGIVAPPAEFTVELLTEALTETVRTVEVAPAELEGRMSLRWGREFHVRPIRRGSDVSQEAVAAYVAKYATKGSESLGEGRVNAHIRRLRETAWDLGVQPQFADLRLTEAVTELGFRGHFSTRSRTYSTTLKAKRQVRRDYAQRRRLPKGTTEFLDCWGRPEEDEAVVVEARWSYAGSGYRNNGERWLALSAAARAREWRRIAREEMQAVAKEAS
ncbi:MAG: replication initiator, partial [Actinomycetota bacterium]